VPQKLRPPMRLNLGDRLTGNPRPVRLGDGEWVRVKRWGKSPPLEWQHSRHGKPRVEQGQIGGEGWPGPYAFGCASLRRSAVSAATLG
jgi:hypothetical protein